MKRLKLIIKSIFKKIKNFVSNSKSLQSPLNGDRCIEYAFVIRSLIKLNKNSYKTVLDVGCYSSPLTTIIAELGYKVDGIDLPKTSYRYKNINYIQGDFLKLEFNNLYDIVVLCSTIEHIGIGGRYKSDNIIEGDIKALNKVKKIIKTNGILVLTLPYGKECVIQPFHRVYNKESKLLRYVYSNFKIVTEEFYINNDKNIWINCCEGEARSVDPTEDNYALGLFVFKNFN